MNNMFQPHNQNATATAIIEGLAVSKYNIDTSEWEVTFLRNCGHYPKLTINEVDRKTGAIISTLTSREIEEGDIIFITVSDPAPIDGWKYEVGDNFSRDTAGQDPQDLRWMLDINQLSKAPVKRLTDGIPTNPLSISNGYFYTSVITKGTYQNRWVDPQGTPSGLEPLGQTGKTFGSDFKGSSVTIKIQGTKPYSETLPDKADSRYELIFDNTCIGEEKPPEGQTDFYYYYRLFNSSDGRVEIFPQSAAPDVVAYQQEPYNNDPAQDPKDPACQAILEGGNQ